ncbi:glutaredoxin family protein [Aeromonas sobria]|uniref:glutaredoxin family protein n=1 Tax=Aeromonas sobria TaxID=646 RepID=UPI0011173E51|nr:glutaredoxin family protein [Aeromonas sobria]TNH87240.1 NrdH-redoxin [Aeromonas sobria]
MLTLFHTDGCHLCEQAWGLVEQAGLAATTRQSDIMDDEQWLAAYRVRIPVLRDEAGRELGWPFTLVELMAWAAHRG